MGGAVLVDLRGERITVFGCNVHTAAIEYHLGDASTIGPVTSTDAPVPPNRERRTN